MNKIYYNTVKRTQQIVLFLFIGLIVFDIVLVFVPYAPTISQIVYDSSPQYIFIVYIFGTITNNVLFMRKTYKQINKIQNFIILLLFGFIFFLIGYKINKNSISLNCNNYLEKYEKIKKNNFFIRMVCIDIIDPNKPDGRKNRVCTNFNCGANDIIKYDFNVFIKFMIFLFGLLISNYLWPSLNNPIKN